MSESRGLVQFEQKEKSIRGKEALDVPERLPQIARSVQRIGGENQIELVRLEALRIGRLLDVERLVADEWIRGKFLFSFGEERPGDVGENIFRLFRGQAAENV